MKMHIGIYIILVLFMFCGCNSDADFYPINLKVKYNHFEEGEPQVFFSWQTQSATRGFLQEAYELEVYSTDNSTDLIWNSKNKSGEQLNVMYKGKGLTAGGKYKWRIRVKDKQGSFSNWSDYATFYYIDKFSKHSIAKWITFQEEKASAQPVFGKSFIVNNLEDIKDVQLLISGMGYYEALLNGKKVGDHVLDPAQTNYEDYAFYVHYSIPNQQLKEKNELKVLLGDGFYNQDKVWHAGMSYGKPKLLASLQIRYKDGTVQNIDTDENWMWANGPILKSNVYTGEHYDATKDYVLSEALDKSHWFQVQLANNNPPKVIPQTMQPVRVVDTIQVKAITHVKGKYIFDFGQNFAGVVQLNVNAPKGTKIIMRYAEALYKDGSLDTRSTGVFATKHEQVDSYICKGDVNERWQPKFTYHGFRYVEVEGIQNPDKESLLGMVIHSDLPSAGSFSCSSENINRLHKLNYWSLRSNLHGIPTDCPQREKCGWLGDAHVMTPTMMCNFDSHQFLKKYLYDIRSSAQKNSRSLVFKTHFHDRDIEVKPAGIPFMVSPGKRNSGTASADWGTAITQIPWHLYVHYGDIEVLKDFYPMMKQWVNYIHSRSYQGIVKYGLGDWCPPGAHSQRDCPIPLSSTAFHYLDITILLKTAELLDKQEDKLYFESLKTGIEQSFHQSFFNDNSRSYGSQTANSLALGLSLVPKEYEKDVSNAIVESITDQNNGFIKVGMFGLAHVFDALYNYGNEEVVAYLFNKSGYNSFSYMWEHYNATTMWEVLPVDDYYDNPEKNDQKRSLNHSIHISPDSWFYRGIAGITPDETEPGYKKIKLKPGMFNFLKFASATYNSPYGTIKSNWQIKEDVFLWSVSIPPNSRGDLHIPVFSTSGTIQINGKVVEYNNIPVSQSGNRYYILEGELSGNYDIKVTYQKKAEQTKQ